MYYYLHGTVTMHLKNAVVVECGGVGYDVLVSHPADFSVGETVRLYTSFYVREDGQFLVGFSSFAEKAVYEKLVSVKGLGPKTAMSILGGCSVQRLQQAIEASDVAFMKKLPNVGPKMASQIVLDLKGKLTLPLTSGSGEKELDDAVIGLKNMGFSQQEIDSAVQDIPDRGLTTEEYLRRALSLLGKRR